MIHFNKYQGAGNDFILLDNRDQHYRLSTQEINWLCDRRFGIGGDGLMLLEKSREADFHMVYFNSDGKESSMCGNGGRCITAFAKKLGLVQETATFTAIDGLHHARFEKELVVLKMNNVFDIDKQETFFQLNTGSPHYVTFCDHVQDLDIKKEGRLIRYSPKYKEEGINVNFVEVMEDNSIYVATYERGVEDETFSCGTGVTAAAIAHWYDVPGSHRVNIKTKGGLLTVLFTVKETQLIEDIYLQGPAEYVFEGKIELP